MDLLKTSKFMMEYGVCPNCKNDKVGAGYGAIVSNETMFFRSCKCGWSIRLDKDGNELPKLKENLDNRVCDTIEHSLNTHTYREFINMIENQLDMTPADLDSMEEVDLVRYLDFLSNLVVE